MNMAARFMRSSKSLDDIVTVELKENPMNWATTKTRVVLCRETQNHPLGSPQVGTTCDTVRS